MPEETLFLLLGVRQVFVLGIVSQGPDNDGGDEDGGRHLLQILPALLPGMPSDCLCGRDAVGRKLHHEGEIVVPDNAFQHQCGKNRQHNPEQIDAHQRKRRSLGEEGAHEQHENGQAAGTRHEWHERDGNQPALAALDGAGGHYGRHVAAEPHHHGDETLAVQAKMVHEFINYECCAGHVAGILHYGDEKVQNEDVGEEHEYTPHTRNYAVHQKVFEPAFHHHGRNQVSELAHQPIYPVHRILPESEGCCEDEI